MRGPDRYPSMTGWNVLVTTVIRPRVKRASDTGHNAAERERTLMNENETIRTPDRAAVDCGAVHAARACWA